MRTDQTAVSALMSKPVVVVGPNARTHEVLALADAEGVHHFPIVEHDKLVGIVCTCDLQELDLDAKVMQVAWRHVIALPPEGSVTDAARLMMMQGVGSIVVIDDGGIHGIVTREDLVRANPELDQLLWEARCAACGTRRHLRPGPDGQCICKDCQIRVENADGDDAEAASLTGARHASDRSP